jgi:hypothetical protein
MGFQFLLCIHVFHVADREVKLVLWTEILHILHFRQF